MAYALATSYVGEALLSGFNWFDGADPSHGFVSYQSRPNAESMGLYSVDESTGVVRLGVDSTNVLSLSSGRPSIRLESKEAYNQGLFIADFLHMPPSQCGLWPAFWSYGPNWPYDGEVDIIEGANDQYRNLMSAHTASGCTISNSLDSMFSASQRSTNCYIGTDNIGCGYEAAADDISSYGDGFNAAGGGVYAMEWDAEYIKIWHFARSQIPGDITAKQPNPAEWGLPDAIFGGDSCDVDNYFKDLSLVININFCGDWGSAIWGKADNCGQYASTCNDFVANNPQAFANAYWDVRYIDAYQMSEETDLPPNVTSSGGTTTMTRSLTTTVTLSSKKAETTSSGVDSTGEIGTDATLSSEAAETTSRGVDSTGRFGTNASVSSNVDETTTGSQLDGNPTAEVTSDGNGIKTTTYIFPHGGNSTTSVTVAPSGVDTAKTTDHDAKFTSTRVAIPGVTSSFVDLPAATSGPKDPLQIDGAALLGCFGSSDGFKSFQMVADRGDMTVERCVKLCEGAMFAGAYDTQCFCAESLDVNTRAVDADVGVCDHACPGDGAQVCGGLARTVGSVANNTMPTLNSSSSAAATSPSFRRTSNSLTQRDSRPDNMLLTVYGAPKNQTDRPPPPPMAPGQNVTYTFTPGGMSTSSAQQIIETVVPVPSLSGEVSIDSLRSGVQTVQVTEVGPGVQTARVTEVISDRGTGASSEKTGLGGISSGPATEGALSVFASRAVEDVASQALLVSQSVASLVSTEVETSRPTSLPENETSRPVSPPENETTRPVLPTESQTSQPLLPTESQTSQPVLPPKNETSQPLSSPESQTSQPVSPPEKDISQPVSPPETQTSQPLSTSKNETSQPVSPPESQTSQPVSLPAQNTAPQPLSPPENQTSQPVSPPKNESSQPISPPAQNTAPQPISPPENQTSQPIAPPLQNATSPPVAPPSGTEASDMPSLPVVTAAAGHLSGTRLSVALGSAALVMALLV